MQRNLSVEKCGTMAGSPDSEGRFSQAMRRVATGVSVVTTWSAGRRYGLTLRSFIVASADPPTLLISIAADDASAQAIGEAGVFCVNVLADGEAQIAQAFAPKAGEAAFADGNWHSLSTGAPALEDCLVSLDCRVRQTFSGAGFLVFAGEIVATELWGSHRAPLINHDETFIRL